MGIGDLIRSAESGGDPNASNPNSSALGPDQFIASTWLNTLKSARPDLAQGQSDADLLALRTNPQLSGEMRDVLASQNQAILQKNGLPVTDGTTYLAHFAGPGGAVKILQADPNASAADILGPGAVKANPFLANMTAQGLQAWAARKMGVQVPQAGVQTTAQASPASPTNAIPQQSAPMLPQQAQQAPQAAPQAAPQFSQIPEAQAPPIFYAPRKPINLAALRGAFSAPVFPKG